MHFNGKNYGKIQMLVGNSLNSFFNSRLREISTLRLALAHPINKSNKPIIPSENLQFHYDRPVYNRIWEFALLVDRPVYKVDRRSTFSELHISNSPSMDALFEIISKKL